MKKNLKIECALCGKKSIDYFLFEKTRVKTCEKCQEAMKKKDDVKTKEAIREEIRGTCKRFPIPDSFV